METSFLSAIIPAAGYSSRMHQYKPLLPLGDKPMAALTIHLFQKIGIHDILVITGHNHDKLAPVIEQTGAKAVFNSTFDQGMFSSIQTGVRQIQKQAKGFFLLPVDTPLVRPETLNTLTQAFARNPNHIIIPEFNETLGHPPLIPGQLIPEILAMDPQSNLRELILSKTDRTTHVPVHDRAILMDADTPQAYGALTDKFNLKDIPEESECWSIIHGELPGEIHIHNHLELVTKTADHLCRGLHLNRPLLRAAALLHDIKRKEPHHARAGSTYLKSLGFFRVAHLVARHMTLTQLTSDITEAEVLFLADKLCQGDCFELNYKQRFMDKINQNPSAQKEILHRYETARHIQARIETIIGSPIFQGCRHPSPDFPAPPRTD